MDWAAFAGLNTLRREAEKSFRGDYLGVQHLPLGWAVPLCGAMQLGVELQRVVTTLACAY